MRIVLAVLISLTPVLAQAAYLDPIVLSNERQLNGSTKMVFEFSGDAGEPTVRREYTVSAGTTQTVLRNWIYSTISELNLMHAAATLAGLQPRQTVPKLAPTTSTPTAQQVWMEKARRAVRMKAAVDAGVTALSTDLATLLTDLNGSYVTSYAEGF